MLFIQKIMSTENVIYDNNSRGTFFLQMKEKERYDAELSDKNITSTILLRWAKQEQKGGGTQK